MRIVLALLLTFAGLVRATESQAHPHIWIQEVVRVVTKDGKYTHVEIEWRFDPFSSEIEIPLIDENKDGKFSAKETKTLADEMMPELKNYGYLTWLNTGGKDFRPPQRPAFSARVDDPASFVPPEWDKTAGDNSGMPMPANKRGSQADGPRKNGPRNLVYIMRFALPEPTKKFSVVTYDPDDFMRLEVDKASIPSGCTHSTSPAHKTEFVRGYPVFADIVTCQLP